MSEQIERLNYTSKAIPDVRKQAANLKAQGSRHSANMYERLAVLMDQSVKFMLPDGGWLFDFEGYKESDLELFYPPYPVVSCEYFNPHIPELNNHGAKVEHQIAFASDFSLWEDLLGHPPTFNEEGGVIVGSIFFNQKLKSWGVIPAFLGIPKSMDILSVSKSEKDKYRKQINGHPGLFQSKGKVGYQPAVFSLGELGEEYKKASKRQGIDPFLNLKQDLGNEEVAIVQLFASLNCENVNTETISPPDKLQKKRAKNGKKPLYEYKVLQVGVPKYKQEQGVPGPGVDSRSSPRVHLRRGHIRRTPNGKAVWVQPHVVGDKRQGVVHKDYQVNSNAL